MNCEIKYDLSYLDEALSQIKALKSKLPIHKGSHTSYEWDYLYTNKSKGDTIDKLFEFYSLTESRAYKIEELLNNVSGLIDNAKEQMKDTDDKISKEINKK